MYTYIYTLNLFNSKYHMHCNLVVKLSTMLELHVIKHFQEYFMSPNVVQRCAQFTLPRLHCTSFVTYTYPFQLFASFTSTSSSSSSSNPSLCSSLSFIFRLPSTLSFICAFSRRFSCCCFCCCPIVCFSLCCVALSVLYSYPLLPPSS